jgi:hypothetical protein
MADPTQSRRELLLVSAGAAAVLAGVAGAQEKPAAVPPKALVFDHADKWTRATGLADQLGAAGFVVEALPLDRSPFTLDADVIALGSFASESPDYKAYVGRFGKELYKFVDQGRVLIQFAQADQTEPTPPFLLTTLGVKRIDADFDRALILAPGHPLMKGVPHKDGVVRWDREDKRTIWETLAEADGFEVVMAAEKEAVHPALIEGAYGQGRIVLTAVDFDKTTLAEGGRRYGSDAQRAFAGAFFKNLHAHAINVRNGTTAAPVPTPRVRPAQEFVEGSWTLAVMPDT